MADSSVVRAPTHVAGRPWADAVFGALADPDPAVRRLWLGVLDHEANDAATEVFRRALADPVPDVRGAALHGLTCERCREGELCPADVVPDVSVLVAGDPDPEIRIKAIKVLWTLARGEPGALPAVVAAAAADPDPAVRRAASLVAAGHHPPSHKRLRRQARSRRSKAASRAGAQVRDGEGGC